ncbi:MAG TPA: RluA family pseudouridine synthase [Solibacterales bacterium]|nr:RluA family pseudouridine synthase [Bryobacterales bacterium]
MLLTAEPADTGKRLDHFLQQRLPAFSRSRLQEWVKAGRVLVNGAAAKASFTLRGGERIEVEPAAPPPLRAEPEDLPLDVLYEDADVIAVNKPAGMVVHAGAGRHEGTLVNALLHRYGGLSESGGPLRPGIVHRLDRETSGVLLVARNDVAHRHLAAQFASRQVKKIYWALVEGSMRGEAGRIERPVVRHPEHRHRMTSRLETGRAALTEWRVLRRWENFTFLEVRIGTGRTHQIRVHLSDNRHPVAGDRVYGAKSPPRGGRFFLHAARITFDLPGGGPLTVEAPLPGELEEWLAAL